MNRLFVLIAAVAATVSGVKTLAQTTGKAPFGAGEELVYNVSYRAALIPPINMMMVTVRTFEEEQGGVGCFHIVGNGRTTGAAQSLFDMNDTYHTWLDARNLLPIRTTSDIREDSYRLTATYNYDWNTMTVSGVRRNSRWEADRHATFPLQEGGGDALSLLYRLRAVDLGALTIGEPNTLPLVLSEDSKPIVFRFAGREEIKVRKTGRFRALKFTCTMVTSDGSTYEEGMTFTAWISDDENHIPLLVESPVRIGRVSVALSGGFRTVQPLASKITD